MALVAEGDVFEADLARGIGPAASASAGSLRLDRRVEQLEDALAAGHEAGEPGRELRERRQRGVEHRQVGEERHQRAERHLPGEHVAAADVPDDQAAQAEDQRHDRRERGGGLVDRHARLPQVVAGCG